MRREVFFVPNEHEWVQKRLEMVKQAPSSHLELFKAKLFSWIAEYSGGVDIGTLSEKFRGDVLPAVHQLLAHSPTKPFELKSDLDYQLVLALYSLSVLLEVPNDEISKFSDLFESEEEDSLVNIFSIPTQPGSIDFTKIIHRGLYEDLLKCAVQKDPILQSEFAIRFLRNYYKALEGLPWYDSHLDSDSGFFGYWSFELAAVVKLYGIDDRPFCENIFYPRDLVNEPLFRTWLPSGFGSYHRDRVHKLHKAWDADIRNNLGQSLSDEARLERDFRNAIQEIVDGLIGGGKSPIPTSKSLDDTIARFHFLSGLTGLEQEDLQKNPEWSKTIILSMMKSLRDFSSGPILESAPEGWRDSVDQLILALAKEEGISPESISSELPEEISKAIQERGGKNSNDEFKKRMSLFSDALSGLIDTKDASEKDLLTALEILAGDFGFSIPEDSRIVSLRTELDAKWKDIRKGKEMVDFSFDDLFNGD